MMQNDSKIEKKNLKKFIRSTIYSIGFDFLMKSFLVHNFALLALEQPKRVLSHLHFEHVPTRKCCDIKI